jgi:hypothetical protein
MFHYFSISSQNYYRKRREKREIKLMTMMRKDSDGRLSVVEHNERNISVCAEHRTRKQTMSDTSKEREKRATE